MTNPNPSSLENESVHRPRLLRLAIQIEAMSLAWIFTEVLLSAIAAISVGSLAISAFSVDSAIEMVSGVVLFVRLFAEYQSGHDGLSKLAERIASLVVGICLFLLAGYIAFKSGQAFAVKHTVEVSHLGLAVAAASGVITPWLAKRKHQLGNRLHSHALIGDAACSMTCAYMSWTLMFGLVVQWAFGWWWIDAVAALGILYFVLREAFESLLSAKTGMAHNH